MLIRNQDNDCTFAISKKNDCRASQLEWVTQSENIQHAWDLGLFKVRGEAECQVMSDISRLQYIFRLH